MLESSIMLVIGLVVGALVTALYTTKSQDREVIEIGLKKTLPSNKFVSIEWIYFHLELAPSDLPTLRDVLKHYIEQGIVVKRNNGLLAPEYKLAVNVLV